MLAAWANLLRFISLSVYFLSYCKVREKTRCSGVTFVGFLYTIGTGLDSTIGSVLRALDCLFGG